MHQVSKKNVGNEVAFSNAETSKRKVAKNSAGKHSSKVARSRQGRMHEKY